MADSDHSPIVNPAKDGYILLECKCGRWKYPVPDTCADSTMLEYYLKHKNNS